MKKASIISIGNELLSGQTVDTNAAYLSKSLLEIGIPTTRGYTIPDEITSIVESMKQAADKTDIVLITGGLGPTDDDLTRQAFAEFLGVELELHLDCLETIEDFFKKRGVKMPEKNKIQAYMPTGCKVLSNDLGTAPGILYENKNEIIAAMPGVPSEMKGMFQTHLLNKLKKINLNNIVLVKKLKCFGTGESSIAEKLGTLMCRNRNPLINCTVDYGIITLHIVAAAENQSRAKKMITEDEKLLGELLGKHLFGSDKQTLAEVVGMKLAQQNKTLAVAESCSGGLIAKWLTDAPGASKFFTYGWVTYSNEAKVSQLGVKAELIEKFGAVSSQVASEMAKGARKKAKTDFSIAVTGIAGPEGGGEQKPVGLVYVAIDCLAGCQTERFIFTNRNRDFIRTRTAQTALYTKIEVVGLTNSADKDIMKVLWRFKTG
jgi:nicotinamide-nucleotide amidase